MIYFISAEELKESGFLNQNLEDIYINQAIEESQDIFVRETLGDNLYNVMQEKINTETLDGVYKELLEQHIKYYMKYKVSSLLCMIVNFKIRNIGVANQYGTEVSTTDLESTKYIEGTYNQKADFYRNRMTKFLELNSKSISEYNCSCNQVTQPNDTHPVCSIYLN